MPKDPIPALKRQLAREILDAAAQMNFFVAAKVLDIRDARLSDLRRGREARFSVERLIRLLATIDYRVELRVVRTGGARIDWMRILRERRRDGSGAHGVARRGRGQLF